MADDLSSQYRAFTEGAGCLALDGHAVLRFSGEDRKKFLQGLVTNDVLKLSEGGGLQACLLSSKGMVEAHFELYELGAELLALVPAACAEGLRGGLSKYLPLSATKLEDAGGAWRALYLAGPDAPAVLSKVLGSAPEPGPFRARAASWEGAPAFVVSHPTLRPDGRLVLAAAAGAAGLRAALGAAGALPCSAEALEVLRVEAGAPAYGRDIDARTLPQEARLEAALSFEKGCYLGQETVSRLRYRGRVQRLLAQLRLAGPSAPRPGAAVLKDGAGVGVVTSAAVSPRRGVLALAMLKADEAKPGNRLEAEGAGTAEVTDLWAGAGAGA